MRFFLSTFNYVARLKKLIEFRFTLYNALGLSIALHSFAFILVYSVSDANFHLRVAGNDLARPYVMSAIIQPSATIAPHQVQPNDIDNVELSSRSIANSPPLAPATSALVEKSTRIAAALAAPKLISLPPASDYKPRSALETTPRLLNEITPIYPENDGLQEGAVVLRILIDETGNVDDVGVVRSNPALIFDAAAVSAFQKAQFSPGKYLGIAVKSQLLIEVNFTPYNRGGLVNGRTN